MKTTSACISILRVSCELEFQCSHSQWRGKRLRNELWVLVRSVMVPSETTNICRPRSWRSNHQDPKALIRRPPRRWSYASRAADGSQSHGLNWAEDMTAGWALSSCAGLTFCEEQPTTVNWRHLTTLFHQVGRVQIYRPVGELQSPNSDPSSLSHIKCDDSSVCWVGSDIFYSLLVLCDRTFFSMWHL